ncbi:MAG: malate dehydrogenase [Nitrospirae bacterium]|nr:malate dehydrogenase [Nitrospirota bacterium]MBF0591555.1 malate dehydrogenase [Nitrospirota bacterium]
MRKKVSIIGAGHVGASTAQLLVYEAMADVVLYDVVEGMPQGKALDLSEACPLYRCSASIIGTNDLADIKGSDIVVITAGIARRPGMSRDDLLNTNANILRGVSAEVARYCPDGVVIVVTNPMDVMAQLTWQASGLPKQRVMGMGAILDAARFRTFVAWQLNVSPEAVEALTLGGHGDQMVPMPRFTTLRGVSITHLLSEEVIKGLVERTRNGGAEVVSLLKSGSAYYAPAASIFQMVKAILFDEKQVLPVACLLGGQYGVDGVFAGVPAVLGKAGVERIIELDLNQQEREDFQRSVDAVKGLLQKLGLK